MHKLVHAWGYDRLAAEEQGKYSQAAFRLVIEAIEGCSRAPEDKLRLVPHVIGSFAALTRAHNKIDGTTEDVIDKIAGMGGFMTDLGRWPETRAIEEYVLQARHGLLGEEHPDTIWAISNLASTLGEQGELDEAAKMKKEVLEKRKRILGEEHPGTISSMSNLAMTLRQQSLQDQEQS
jgi:hypothetical protein